MEFFGSLLSFLGARYRYNFNVVEDKRCNSEKLDVHPGINITITKQKQYEQYKLL
jgi:hypothetical protein